MAAEKKETILEEAQRLISADRKSKYGHCLDDYGKTVGMFNALVAHKLKEPLTEEEGLMFMACVKLAREEHCHQRDNIVDALGYIALIKEVKDERERRGTAT